MRKTIPDSSHHLIAEPLAPSQSNESTPTVAPQRRKAVIDAMRKILPKDSVIHRHEELRPYECDGLPVFRQIPMVVVLPRTDEEVRCVLQACHRMQVPVVARGAGTGLSGGAMPHAAGVTLSLARLDRIIGIDQMALTARVQPGVCNLAVSNAAEPYGLYYAPDPSSQIACSIGGNVAENAGGVHCLKYGLTVHNVLGVRGLTLDGHELNLGGAAPDGPGLDLLSLVIGSEGLLLVVTEVLLKLLPRPPVAQVAMASFDDIECAGEAVAAIIAAGILPAGLEMMDRKATAATEPFVKAGYDLAAEAILLVESDGTDEEVTSEIARIEHVLNANGAYRISISQSEAERTRFWSGRKNAFPAAGSISPDFYCMDGTIPRKTLGRMLRAIGEMEQKYGLRCMNVFHAGDGNLHPLILFDANQPGDWGRAERFGAEISQKCIDVGGTITGEHGVGIEKLDSMCAQFSAAELEKFYSVKAAFDPAGLLNPGKAIPTLNRCAEFGKLHVKGGRMRYPNLPRF